MIIGVPKEIKEDEYRVAIVPAGVELMRRAGHRVLVQKGAGVGSGFSDSEYRSGGATIVVGAREVFRRADMIMKVKEPRPKEYSLLRPGQIVFTFFHFAASRKLTRAMMDRKVKAVAYETVRPDEGGHPLLTPMSEVAGRMSVQEGAVCLEKSRGGLGILLTGVPGVEPGEVVVLGGGVAGYNAAKVAAGLGARVTILEIRIERMRYLDQVMPGNVSTVMSNPHTVRDCIRKADLVIGATLVEGARTPRLISRDDLKIMKPGAVVVDISIDQGGCLETSRPTTHARPTYVVNGVVHYCVANIPGVVAHTSTRALANVTLPYALDIANKGIEGAAEESNAVRRGINIYEGKVTCEAVAATFGIKYSPF